MSNERIVSVWWSGAVRVILLFIISVFHIEYCGAQSRIVSSYFYDHTRIGGGEYSLTVFGQRTNFFYQTGPTNPGHAFIRLQGPDTNLKRTRAVTIGFYPNPPATVRPFRFLLSPKTETKRRLGEILDQGVNNFAQGFTNYGLRQGKFLYDDRHDYDISLRVQIDEDAFKNAVRVLKLWTSDVPRYCVFLSDCVSMVSSVTEAAGIRVPPLRILNPTPIQFVNQMKRFSLGPNSDFLGIGPVKFSGELHREIDDSKYQFRTSKNPDFQFYDARNEKISGSEQLNFGSENFFRMQTENSGGLGAKVSGEIENHNEIKTQQYNTSKSHFSADSIFERVSKRFKNYEFLD